MVVLLIGLLFYLGFSLTEGTTNSRFLQIGFSVGVLVYLATFVDILLGIAFLIACIGLGPEVSWGGMGDLRLEDFIVPALLLSWLTRSAHRREKLVPSPLSRPARVFFALMLLSTAIGIVAGTTAWPKAWPVLLKYVEYYVVFLIVLNNVRTPEEFRGLAVFALLVAAASALLHWGGHSEATAGRLHGPTGETANIFGGYLALHLALGLGLLLHSRTPGSRLLAVAGILVVGGALLRTLSRTSYIALVLGAAVFGVFKERRLLLFLLLLVFVLPFVPESALSRMETLGDLASGPGPSSWAARVMAWDDVIAKLSGIQYLWGQGAGSTPLADVDSEYFRILADHGLLGVGLFAWLLIRLGRRANQAYNALPPRTVYRGYAAGFLIAFVTMTVHAVGATSFTSIRTMEGFVVLAGLVAALEHNLVGWELVPDPEPPAAPALPFAGPRPLPR